MKMKTIITAIALPMLYVAITGYGNAGSSTEEVFVHMEETFTPCEQEGIAATAEVSAEQVNPGENNVVVEAAVSEVSAPAAAPETTPVPAPAPENIAWASIGHEDIMLYPANEDANNVNARVACGYINGYIVKPGETFSYANTVGRGTPPERGYVIAHVVGGYDYGGGVCKISSALYHAAMNAGCRIVERHNHSKPVDYSAQGDDAAIAFRSRKDFRFRNEFAYDVMIQASYDETGYHLDILAPQANIPVPQPEVLAPQPEVPAPQPEAPIAQTEAPVPQPENPTPQV